MSEDYVFKVFSSRKSNGEIVLDGACVLGTISVGSYFKFLSLDSAIDSSNINAGDWVKVDLCVEKIVNQRIEVKELHSTQSGFLIVNDFGCEMLKSGCYIRG